MLRINNVVSYKIDNRNLILLKELDRASELLKLSIDFTELWKCIIPKSYDFFIFKECVYVTTKDSSQTFVINKNDGKNLGQLLNLAIHLPVAYQSDSFVISYSTYFNVKSGILFDDKMNAVEKLNPFGLKVTKVINKDSFISFNKGILNLVEFLTSSIVWSIDLMKEVINRSNEDNVKLRFLNVMILMEVMVVSVFNTKSNFQYLFGIDTNTGLINWIKKSIMNFGVDKDSLFTLEREGEVVIFDVKTGLLKGTKDLSDSFLIHDIICSRGLEKTDNKFFFKDDEGKKLGVIDIDRLELEFVKDLPKDALLSPNEYPKITGEIMIVHDSIAKELYLIDLENHEA